MRSRLLNDTTLQEAIKDICTNHHRIIDDWCKAYLSELYGLGIALKPGCFTLNQMQVNENGNIGWKYWFTIKENNMDRLEKTLEENFEANIKDLFEESCKILFDEKLCEHEFEFCLNIIQTTTTFLKARRNRRKNTKIEAS